MLNSNLPNNARVFINLLVDLNERDKLILVERFNRNKTLNDVAKQFNITSMRIKEIEDVLIKDIDQKFEYVNM